MPHKKLTVLNIYIWKNILQLKSDQLSSIKQLVNEKIKKLSLRQIIIILFFLACITIFLLILVEMVIEKENSLDIFVFNKLRLITSPAVTKFMLFITFFGSFSFLLRLILPLLFLIYTLKTKNFFYTLYSSVLLARDYYS